jgi:hypothetical protein
MCTHNKLATVPEGRRWLHCQKVGCSGNGKHQPSANPIPEFEIFHMFMLFNMVQSCSMWFKVVQCGSKLFNMVQDCHFRQFGYKGRKKITISQKFGMFLT